MSQIDCRIQNTTGRVTLRRPEALNALTHDMCEQLEAALLTVVLSDTEFEKLKLEPGHPVTTSWSKKDQLPLEA